MCILEETLTYSMSSNNTNITDAGALNLKEFSRNNDLLVYLLSATVVCVTAIAVVLAILLVLQRRFASKRSRTQLIPLSDVVLQSSLSHGHSSTVHRSILQHRSGRYSTVVAAAKVSNGSKALQDFFHEALLLSQLEHKNIVKPFGICLNDANAPIILMEYLSGGSLQDALARYRSQEVDSLQRFRWFDCLRIMTHVAEACNYLTTKSIVHRDIAARNVLLTKTHLQDTQVKLADFGLARCIGPDGYYRLQAGDQLPLNCLAPEVRLANTVYTASDVWSYGVFLWETVNCGVTAFNSEKEESLRHFDLKQTARNFLLDLVPFPTEIPNCLFKVFSSCLQTEKQLRPGFSEIESMLRNHGETKSFLNFLVPLPLKNGGSSSQQSLYIPFHKPSPHAAYMEIPEALEKEEQSVPQLPSVHNVPHMKHCNHSQYDPKNIRKPTAVCSPWISSKQSNDAESETYGFDTNGYYPGYMGYARHENLANSPDHAQVYTAFLRRDVRQSPLTLQPYASFERTESLVNEPHTDQSFSDQPFSDQPNPDQPLSDQPSPDQLYSNQPFSDQPYPIPVYTELLHTPYEPVQLYSIYPLQTAEAENGNLANDQQTNDGYGTRLTLDRL